VALKIRFTVEDLQQAQDPFDAETTTVAIRPALDCDGFACQLRSGPRGDEGPTPFHHHLVIRADGGRAGERVSPVLLDVRAWSQEDP